MDRIEDQEEQALIIHACKMFYGLYGDVFRSLRSEHGVPALPNRKIA